MISVLERYDDNPIELINSIRRGQNGFRKDSATSDFFIDKIFPLNNDELTLRGTFNHGKIMNIPVNKGFPEPSKGTPDPSRTSLFCV